MNDKVSGLSTEEIESGHRLMNLALTMAFSTEEQHKESFNNVLNFGPFQIIGFCCTSLCMVKTFEEARPFICALMAWIARRFPDEVAAGVAISNKLAEMQKGEVGR